MTAPDLTLRVVMVSSDITDDIDAGLELNAEPTVILQGSMEAVKAAAKLFDEQVAITRATPAALEPTPDALHRSFPEAGDGRPLPPMGDELMTAGLSAEDARFVAVQLAQNGWTLTPNPVDASQTADPAVNAPDYTLAPHLQRIVETAKTTPQWDTVHDRMAAPDPAAIREAALREAADACAVIRQGIANGPMPEGARFDYEQTILALIPTKGAAK